MTRRHQSMGAVLDTHEEDAVVRAEPFDAIEIPLGALWGARLRDPESRFPCQPAASVLSKRSSNAVTIARGSATTRASADTPIRIDPA